eukprot:gene23255-30482_t
MFARMVLLAFALIACVAPAALAQSIICYTTKRVNAQENCGADCLSFGQVEDISVAGGWNVCLRWFTNATLKSAFTDSFGGDLTGFDGGGVQILTCDDLIDPATGPTRLADQAARTKYPAESFYDGMTYTDFSCCQTDNCNSPVKLEFRGSPASMAFVNAVSDMRTVQSKDCF